MSSSNAHPEAPSTFDLLQDELNEFVAETERRLQTLAQSLNGHQVQIPSLDDPSEHELTKTELTTLTPCKESKGSGVAGPEVCGCNSGETNVAFQDTLAESDPLDRLAAMKKRLAARMENHDDRK